MVEWRKAAISSFLNERKGRYKPDDPVVSSLKRLEKIDFHGNIYLSDKTSKTNMILIKPGDLVISGINVAKGAIAVYEGEEDIAATIHYSSYIFNEEKINTQFFKQFLKSPEFIKLLKEQIKGGIKTEIKPKHLLPLNLKLPGISEQKKIASFFERTEADVNKLSTQVDHQYMLLKQLRQAVLQGAIEGKLTAEWRKENSKLISGENSGDKLLERIKTEKERLVKEGKIKKQKPLPSITEEEKPFELPEGWCWCRLGNIIKNNPRNGYSPKAVNYKTKYKTIKLGATTWGKFNPDQYKYIDETIPEGSVFWLKKGDILIQRSNSIDYVGVSAVYTGESNQFIYPDLIMKIQIIDPISIHYAHLFLSSRFTRTYFREHAKGSQKSMPKINQSVVTNCMFAFPPLPEQQAIVHRVDKIMAVIDDMEQQINKRKEQAEHLMQSVLREAFEENS